MPNTPPKRLKGPSVGPEVDVAVGLKTPRAQQRAEARAQSLPAQRQAGFGKTREEQGRDFKKAWADSPDKSRAAFHAMRLDHFAMGFEDHDRGWR